MKDKLGEVIESSTTGFTAECYELYSLPPFGSLVKTADPPVEIYGVVCQAGTSSIEPGRRPIARGKDEESEAEIYSANPQLWKLLRSEFRVLVIGHKQDGTVYHYLPPKPARIHAFVNLCSPEEVKQFSRSFDFLDLLMNAGPQVPVEELVSATLRQMSTAQEDQRSFLVAAGKELTALLGGEFTRLKAILTRLK
ncbi:MAG: hypothetical protein Q8O43_01290 [Dehalococcoidia bacterium]|nr:hypothetical protein [Dehalococcoidia bacterium]